MFPPREPRGFRLREPMQFGFYIGNVSFIIPPFVVRSMNGLRYPERPKVTDLDEGDKVEWDEDRSIVEVQSVETQVESEGSITVVARAECRGPRGGRVVLETTDTGRNRAKVGNKSWSPAYTVECMEVVDG